MNKEEVLTKLKEGEIVSISKLQREFGIGYVKALELFNELKNDHKLVQGKSDAPYYYLHEPKNHGLNLVFLDIDGVLNSRTTKEKCGPYRGIEDSKVSLLKELIDKTNAKIVLISSWKEWWFKKEEHKSKQDDLANYLDECLIKAGLNVWNKVNDDFATGRGDSIVQFINFLKHKNVEINNYVIFDDEISDYKETKQTKHLVQTSFENGGLSLKHIKQATIILERGILC